MCNETPQAKQRWTLLLVTSRPGQLHDLVQGIRSHPSVDLVIAAGLPEAVAALENAPPVLAIVDNRAGDATGLDVVRRLIKINAFVHTAVLSDADEEEFHHRSEGLGILTRLPLQPDSQDLLRLFDALRRLVPDFP
jgi:DNA-binding NarL/FixJ family response regulator